MSFHSADHKVLILASTTSSIYNTPFDAVIEYDVSQPSPAVDLYFGVDANGHKLYYSGITEYQPFKFAAIGTNEEPIGIPIIWFGNRNVHGHYNCNTPDTEQLTSTSHASLSNSNYINTNNINKLAK
ncbi:MAG: hypothetical protein LBR17_01335 [Bacteroidales bacterium]|jgi:hypothetical protein|nr:hypothetical protein [Bacteroidales bacterium]